MPTTVQAAGVAQETLVSVVAEPARSGVGVIVQPPPFHASASGRRTQSEPSQDAPTATHAPVDAHVTPSSWSTEEPVTPGAGLGSQVPGRGVRARRRDRR